MAVRRTEAMSLNVLTGERNVDALRVIFEKIQRRMDLLRLGQTSQYLRAQVRNFANRRTPFNPSIRTLADAGFKRIEYKNGSLRLYGADRNTTYVRARTAGYRHSTARVDRAFFTEPDILWNQRDDGVDFSDPKKYFTGVDGNVQRIIRNLEPIRSGTGVVDDMQIVVKTVPNRRIHIVVRNGRARLPRLNITVAGEGELTSTGQPRLRITVAHGVVAKIEAVLDMVDPSSPRVMSYDNDRALKKVPLDMGLLADLVDIKGPNTAPRDLARIVRGLLSTMPTVGEVDADNR